jgi:hypothetical protein
MLTRRKSLQRSPDASIVRATTGSQQLIFHSTAFSNYLKTWNLLLYRPRLPYKTAYNWHRALQKTVPESPEKVLPQGEKVLVSNDAAGACPLKLWKSGRPLRRSVR